MKIPTLLGLSMLAVAIALGVLLYFLNHRTAPVQNSQAVEPKNIQVVNVSDTSASIIWQTDSPSDGLVSWGETSDLGSSQNDLRDNDQPTPHLVHMVTLNSLNPSSTYYFKVRSNLSFYPEENLSFKTTPSDSSEDKLSNKTVFGVILDTNLSPIDEALIVLKTDQTSDLATITTSSGNFLLPLINLKTKDLSNNFIIGDKLAASLLVYSKRGLDTVKFTLPLEDKPLPKIILGQDNDFTALTATISAQLKSTEASPSANVNPFDINGDGSVNTYDLSILLQNFGKKYSDPLFNKGADLNSDGIVNQQDLDILKKALR